MTIATANRVTSLVLSPEDQELVDRLRALTGLKMGQAMRLAVRESVAAREKPAQRRQRRGEQAA